MRITNRTTTISAAQKAWLPAIQEVFAREAASGGYYPLRFAITQVEGRSATLEVTELRYDPGAPFTETLADIEVLAPRRHSARHTPFAIVQIVPTGIGCAIGGYAGDACPATNLLAGAADLVVTHPNAVNASELNEMAGNVLYVEGKLLDDFLLGHLALAPRRSNSIGTLIDPTGDAFIDVITETLDAARASGGIACEGYLRLPEPLGVRIDWTSAGCAVGTLQQPQVLLEGAARLVDAGCSAIGALSVIHGVTREAFLSHQTAGRPNPSGGVEAIITHLIAKVFRLATAHAPLPYYSEIKQGCDIDPRSAAEFISIPHYFSVLKGLHRAPAPVPLAAGEVPASDQITVGNVAAVVMPAGALGGLPALAAQAQGIPIIAVEENRSILAVGAAEMGLKNVIPATSYAEAAGMVLALKEGISLESLKRPLGRVKEIAREQLQPLPEPYSAAQG